MAGGPITAMIMHPVVKEELLREAHLQRLERTCRLVDPTPFRNFDGLGDETLMKRNRFAHARAYFTACLASRRS